MPATMTAPTPKDLSNDTELRCRTLNLLQTEVTFISNAEFHSVGADREILRSNEVDSPQREEEHSPPKGLPAHLARLCEADLLSAEVERQLFRRMNFLKFRANTIRSTLDPAAPNEEAVKQVEVGLAEAQRIRDHIVSANMRLVVSIVKKFVTPQSSFDDMLSDGIWCMMQCVEKFDYDRGFRFSTYAYRSVARTVYRQVTHRLKELSQHASNVDELASEIEDEGSSSSMDDHTWSTLRGLLSQMLHKLDRRERFIIRSRHALGGHRKSNTFQSIADKLGVSKERVRQLEQRAVGKLRSMTESVDLDELLAPAAV